MASRFKERPSIMQSSSIPVVKPYQYLQILAVLLVSITLWVTTQSTSSYAMYDYTLGKITQLYNWTWVSIVGYPFYYVTNTGSLSSTQNNFGIYGMNKVVRYGLSAFLEGLNDQRYIYTG